MARILLDMVDTMEAPKQGFLVLFAALNKKVMINVAATVANVCMCV